MKFITTYISPKSRSVKNLKIRDLNFKINSVPKKVFATNCINVLIVFLI